MKFILISGILLEVSFKIVSKLIIEMKETIVLHLIQRKSGGGAEFIAANLNKGIGRYGIKSYILYLQNHKNDNLEKNEFSLEAKTLNPFKNLEISRISNIFMIKNYHSCI